MTTIQKMAAQGDVLFRKVGSVPADAKSVAVTGPVVIIARSVNGNHHVLPSEGVEVFEGSDPLVQFLRLAGPRTITHARPHDTHAPITLSEGAWEVRRQREHRPGGFRRVED